MIPTHNSSAATQFSLANARLGRPVLYFSPEMRGHQIALRALAQQVQISADRLRRGDINDKQMYALAGAPGEMGDIPLFIDGTQSPTMAQIRARAMGFARSHGKPAMIVVDHLQEIQGENPRQDRFEQVSQITKDYRALCEEMGAAGLLVSHVGRDVAQRANHRPQLPDLYGSSFIEKNADNVWFIYRPEYYLKRNMPDSTSKEYDSWYASCERVKHKAEIFSAKARMGKLGTADIRFNEALTLFYDKDEQSAEDVQQAMDLVGS